MRHQTICTIFSLLGIMPVLLAVPSHADNKAKHPFSITLPLNALTKKNVSLVRGTPLQIEGDIPAELEKCTFALESSGAILARGDFEKHWKLTWDTTQETQPVRSIKVIVARENRAPTQIAMIYVEMLEKSPFDIKVTAPSKLHDPLLVSIKPTGNLNADRFTFKLDGIVKPVEFEKDQAKIDLEGILPGKHQLIAYGKAGDTDIELPADFTLDTPLSIQITSGDILPPAALIPVRFKAMPPLQIKSAAIVLDGKRIAVLPEERLDNFSLVTANIPSGDHTLYIDAEGADKEHYLSYPWLFKIAKGPQQAAESASAEFPADLKQWLDTFQTIRADQLRSLDAIETQRSKEYISLKSLTDAEAILVKEQKFASTYVYSISKKSLPSQISGENSRTLRLALQQMDQSFQYSHEAIRILRNVLVTLYKYDGTMTNVPENVAISIRAALSGGANSVSSNLSGANSSLNQALSNVNLVQKRLGQ